MALQLVGALKGSALEVLNQLPTPTHTSYSKVAGALERRYGHQHQTEVYRARFRARTRGPGESLTHLAQDLEVLVRRAYPEAGEDMLQILLRDQFVDAVDNVQVRVYIQQAHVTTLQEALARGLELESILRSSARGTRASDSLGPVKARKGRVRSPLTARPRSPPPGVFRGNCFRCGQLGHSRKYCPNGESQARSPPRRFQYRPCCWNCGKGHQTSSCPAVPPTVTAQSEGNSNRLGGGAQDQPVPMRPHSA